MPKLRVLELKLGQPEDVAPQPFWPPGYPASSPCPELCDLTLSCPQVDDQVYRSLPHTLTRLALRYTRWKRGYYQPLPARWQWPLLKSSELLQALRQCDLHSLGHLEVEYRVDELEDELLGYVCAAFPALTSLRLFRSRQSESQDDDVPCDIVDRIIRHLSYLVHLRSLDLSLDLPGTPRAELHLFPGPFPGPRYPKWSLERFKERLGSIADLLARTLGPELTTIKLWRPQHTVAFAWLVYEVVRNEGELRTKCVWS
ncbi:hypothetical protein BD414DRAFT_312139 [Trametes punicea]|nr:hypothetical protein BD414DRAFT_312139 [Trametes punicea]